MEEVAGDSTAGVTIFSAANSLFVLARSAAASVLAVATSARNSSSSAVVAQPVRVARLAHSNIGVVNLHRIRN
jgi:hypothetical protein